MKPLKGFAKYIAAPITLVAGVLALNSTLNTAPVSAEIPALVGSTPLPSLAPMIEQATPAVVNIATEGQVEVELNPLLNDPFFRRFFNVPNMPTQRKTQALGSGVIIDAAKGLVVTNNHVIANADQIRVKLRDGRTLEAEKVGTDPSTDIALIKIPADKLTALPVANSDALRVGDFVVAIGNPFGLGQTVTSGIISALARTGLGIGDYEDYIQTDASINPGNSGGALVNLRGELVGINTAIFSKSGGNIGIGFAIPSNNMRRIVAQLEKTGTVKHGYLGAQMQELNAELAQAFGVQQSAGAVVVAVEPDSPADQAGLKAGDVVTQVNGRPMTNPGEVRNQIGLSEVGEKVSLKVQRGGREELLTAVIAERPADGSAYAPFSGDPRLSGATLGDADETPASGGGAGVSVAAVERGSRAWRNGLRAGDLITSVNRVPVNNLQGLFALLPNAKQLVLGIKRGNGAAFIVMK